MKPSPERDDPPPLDAARLNEAERAVLDLLAHGHTAKSIASLTGRSLASVNERLREARRKTGFASSRELARRYHAQKIGDEQIVLAVPTPEEPLEGSETAPTRAARSKTRGPIIMATILSAAVLIAIAQVQSPSDRDGVPAAIKTTPTSQAPDPASVVLTETAVDPRQLYALVRSEARDPDWSPRMEAALRARYAKVRHVDGPDTPLSVRCGATVCEVAGATPPRLPSAELNNMMMELQGGLRKDVESYGLEPQITAFRSPRTDRLRMLFAAYWKRKPV